MSPETDSFYTVLISGMLLFRLSQEGGEWLSECMDRCIDFVGEDLFGAPLRIRPNTVDTMVLESPESRKKALAFGRSYADLYDDDTEPWR